MSVLRVTGGRKYGGGEAGGGDIRGVNRTPMKAQARMEFREGCIVVSRGEITSICEFYQNTVYSTHID